LDKRKQAKIQWLQNPNQSNGDNLNTIRCAANRHFRNKKKEYLKAKINELETNSKNENLRDLYRGINDFKKGYQPRTKVKDENGDLVADSQGTLARWRNHFLQLFNVCGVNDVRQTEVCMAEPLVPEPRVFEVEMAIEKLKRHKSPDIDRIPAELNIAGWKTIRSEIHKLIISTVKIDQQIDTLFTIIYLDQCQPYMFWWPSHHHQEARKVTGSVLHLKSYSISFKKDWDTGVLK
jgi:hypothetical protein